ncbi:hypothetical protein HVX57_10420 [Klebsiella michiganensis]|uniref:hypothetical protein n=1 Tax=Klebsiella michiganensis TaxID=1134687 RepID=UPI0015E49A90|nr:hypothetical protein [Klebsiella michiganensis]MBA8306306.1 hypothetical protein [Klebsiella michiganensis]QLP35858.1 hypothetical protein HVX57_10420 [Klebsiella michiganensis]WFX49498.1 hypothetical protein NFK05_10445 [Klebsiella michiganensis]WFX55158.1 hypothetical protein NFK06_10440 [Klebsiella michiganensis]
MIFQIAKLYRCGRFIGYGIAVEGHLLDGQISTTISAEANSLATVTAVFNMSNEHAENQITICLDGEGSAGKVDLIKQAVAEAADRNYRDVVEKLSKPRSDTCG